jgi:hypothetical protein
VIRIGRSVRVQALGPFARPCGACGVDRTCDLGRDVLVATMMGIPIASCGVEYFYTCRTCRARSPGPAPPGIAPLPFLWQFGGVVLLAIIAGCVLTWGAVVYVQGRLGMARRRLESASLAVETERGQKAKDALATARAARDRCERGLSDAALKIPRTITTIAPPSRNAVRGAVVRERRLASIRPGKQAALPWLPQSDLLVDGEPCTLAASPRMTALGEGRGSTATEADLAEALAFEQTASKLAPPRVLAVAWSYCPRQGFPIYASLVECVASIVWLARDENDLEGKTYRVIASATSTLKNKPPPSEETRRFEHESDCETTRRRLEPQLAAVLGSATAAWK